jgi:hypothetical protein
MFLNIFPGVTPFLGPAGFAGRRDGAFGMKTSRQIRKSGDMYLLNLLRTLRDRVLMRVPRQAVSLIFDKFDKNQSITLP